MHFNRRNLLLLPPILGVAILLHGLASRPIWADEYFTWAVVFDSGFQSRVMGDIHPPLYYLIAILFTKFLHGGLVSLRMLSIDAAILSMFFAYILCKRYFGRLASDIFIILIPLNCHLILFSRMGRYYSLLMLFVLMAQLAFDKLTERKSTGNTILYTFTLALCFYTNLVSLLLIPAHIFASAIRRKNLGYVFAGQALAVATLMAWAPVVWWQLSRKDTLAPFGNEFPLTLTSLVMRMVWPFYDFTFGENILPWQGMFIIPGVAVIVLSLIWFLFRGTYRLEFVGYFIIILTPLALLTGTVLPVGLEFLPPRVMFLMPFWMMVIAAGISRLPKALVPVPVMILLLISLWGNYQYFNYSGTFHSTYIIPWAEIAADADKLAGDKGFIICDDESIDYYLHGDSRVRFLATLEHPRWLLNRHKPVVLVINPRDITPGGLLGPLMSDLDDAGYYMAEKRDYVTEDENSLRLKQKLLKREISPVKREIRLYLPGEGAKE